MPSDIEGIDEIADRGASVQLVFHAPHDWLGDADVAHAEMARKLEACTRFLRSPDFRQRFGMKPGTILMRAARQPPAEVMSEMARLGADVEVGGLTLAGTVSPTVTCAMCRRGGFANAQMSITENGLTCPACFSSWTVREDARSSAWAAPAGGGGLSSWQLTRIVLGVSLALIVTALRFCL